MAVTQDWSRIVNTTMHNFIREEEINILRNRKLLAMMQDRGRISFNHSGDIMDWKARYKRSPMQGYADSDTLTFSRRDRWKTAQLDWRGYAATDSMTKLERLKNKNVEAIIKVYSAIGEALLDDMNDQFGDQLYIDGNAAGNGKFIHGIETMFSSASSSAGNRIGTNGATYAGLSTVLANYGGSWSGTWPQGSGDAHYDFWTPLIIDYTNTGWTAATKTWPNVCREAMRYGSIFSKKNKNKKGGLDLILLEEELYREFLNAQDGEERAVIQRGGPGVKSLYEMGFGDVVNFEGIEVSYEYGVPVDSSGYGWGYGWSMENLELCSLQGQLFVPEGPDFDISSQSYRFTFDFFGNLKMNPRCFVKFMKLT